MLLEALRYFHTYDFPILKFSMQECSFDIHNTCQHACHNHEHQHNSNSCWVCDPWADCRAAVVLSFNLLESSCILSSTQHTIALLFQCPNTIDELSAHCQILSEHNFEHLVCKHSLILVFIFCSPAHVFRYIDSLFVVHYLGWQCQQMCLLATPLKWQTFCLSPTCQKCRPDTSATFCYVSQFFGCRRRVGETCCRHTLLHVHRNQYWWGSHNIRR